MLIHTIRERSSRVLLRKKNVSIVQELQGLQLQNMIFS